MIYVTVSLDTDEELGGSAVFVDDWDGEDVEFVLRESIIAAAGECLRNAMYDVIGPSGYNVELFEGELEGRR